MDTTQIEQLLRADPYTRDVFAGVYPRDRLPRVVKNYPSAYICNSQPHGHVGEHWLLIYVDKHGRGEYFDSYGFPPFYQKFVNFLNTQCTMWKFNEKQLQGLTSQVCGHYCIFYLLHRCRGLSMDTIVNIFGPGP